MRQILIGSSKAFIARMPRPTLDAGSVLVRTHYSLISTGTELASLRPTLAAADGSTAIERVTVLTNRAQHYLGKAVRNPALAFDRALSIARNAVQRRLVQAKPKAAPKPIVTGEVAWTQQSATELTLVDGKLSLTSGGDPGHYQAASQALVVPANYLVAVRLQGNFESGSFLLGLLNHDKSSWIGLFPLSQGALDEVFHFDPGGSHEVTLVVLNGPAAGQGKLVLDEVAVTMVPHDADVPVTEMTDQGWNVGYSLAGEVIAVGDDITDIQVGDQVACAGAGQANHADYVVVKRNLVCRVPDGCSLQEAATATVGTIALQGVRRAAPQLGEVVCVLGLGLIGLISVQLLKANGCKVVGLDLDAARCKRAVELGAVAADPNVARVQRMVNDLTGGQGVDATLITAGTKSNSPINTAMELTRRRGRVVISGDVGLKVERATFYRKEIDLLMSTSYGPGRYDREYEDFGRDYPYAFVRWTANRNMGAYLDLLVGKKIDVATLIDRVVPIDEAPGIYSELAATGGPLPIGVLIAYPDETKNKLPDPPNSSVIHLRGHRRTQGQQLNYALVGAGGFGTFMLVPMMDKRKDRFFLRAVVSRDAVRGGNFARTRQVEIFSSSYEDILKESAIDLVVLATRHSEHSRQVIQAIEAGKHVFVEKPLAISWDELDAIRNAYAAQSDPPRVMVGFNRRFSPAFQLLKQELGAARPLMVNYRLNAGYIPLDNWVHGAEGGGRNIGEACHMYDCFAYLTDAPVASISATAIDPGGGRPYARNDNFFATIRYQDGSVCTLTYTALGPKSGLPKERVEVFANGEAWIVDDYKSLTRASDETVLWSASNPDKGHAEELSRFGDCIVQKGASPIPFEQMLETSAVALHVEDLLAGRGSEFLP